MNTKEIKPCTTNLCEVCKQIYDKKEDGVNSLQTLNPYGTHKRHCAKLNWLVDFLSKRLVLLYDMITNYLIYFYTSIRDIMPSNPFAPNILSWLLHNRFWNIKWDILKAYNEKVSSNFTCPWCNKKWVWWTLIYWFNKLDYFERPNWNDESLNKIVPCISICCNNCWNIQNYAYKILLDNK